MRRCLICSLTVAVLCTLVLAQASFALDPSKALTQYAHRIWGQEEGLFQPTVYAILQTHDGFLWLGTQDSLIRFDGVHFHEFSETGRPVLNRSLIRALLEDDEKNLWIASIGAGVARISPDGSLKRYTTKEGLPSDTTFCLASDSDGSIWVCTNQGLARLKGERVRVFTTRDGLPSNQIRATCEAKDGTRWVAGLDFGLSRWNGSQFTAYSNPRLHAGAATALLCGENGSVWAGDSSGLTEIRDGKLRRLTAANGLPDNEVSSLAAGPDGSVWVGTNDGISRYKNGEISVYRTRDGLSHSVVLSLYIDREGSLWAGTKDGLDEFTDGKVTPYTTSEGLLSNDAGPVLDDGAGHLWMGTMGSGLNVLDDGHFHAFTMRDGLASNTVLSLARDGRGGLWVGTDKGLNRIAHGKIVAAYATANGLSGPEVTALATDQAGILWAGTNVGLDRFNGTRFASAALSGRIRSRVVALAPGNSRGLFVSLDDLSVDYLRGPEMRGYSLNINHPVDCYLVDSARQTVWMGTSGSGLLRWKNSVITHIRVKDGLYDNRIYSILQDDSANFWMASSKGIFRIRTQDLEDFANGRTRTFNSIPFSTGQLRFECRSGVQPAASRTPDGRLWFSTNNGLVVVDPNHLINNRAAPPVSVTAVFINGKPVEARGGIELKPFERNLEIRYAGLSFIAPEKVTFRYMLSGFDKSWVDAGSRREAFFTNLPPGNFRFQVVARNADGIWSKHPAILGITIQPRLYQRRWFWPLLSVLLALAIAAFYRMRIRRLRNNFDLVLAERTRIARELHDTLLQGLSGITMQMQALWTRLPGSREKNALRGIIADAGNCATEARRSLWGLRTLGPGSEEFADKLRKIARQAVADKAIRLVLRVDSVSLSAFPDLQYQLLRVAQEAISNSVRHSQANTLKVHLSLQSANLHLTIQDDGIGISGDPEAAGGEHFGVKGMRERAAEIGAELIISSSPGHGTKVSISLPLTGPVREGNLEQDFEHHLN